MLLYACVILPIFFTLLYCKLYDYSISLLVTMVVSFFKAPVPVHEEIEERRGEFHELYLTKTE